MSHCCPDAAQAEEREVVRSAATTMASDAPSTNQRLRMRMRNEKCIACERTNAAQLMRGCATDFSCHADHMDMRLARRDARIDKCDRHT